MAKLSYTTSIVIVTATIVFLFMNWIDGNIGNISNVLIKNVSQRNTNLISWSFMKAEPHQPAFDCYILHKTHKMMDHYQSNRFKNAQQQIESYSNCQYILLFWIGELNEHNLPIKKQNDISYLRLQIGEDNVFVVDYNKTNFVFNDIFNEMWNKSNLEWLSERSWAWNSADIPEMIWAYYQFYDKQYNENTIIWMLEYDVMWTGNLAKLLLDTSENSLNQNNETYLAVYMGKRKSIWPHINKRYPGRLYENKTIYACQIQLVRYKPILLLAMIEQMKNKTYMYCEMRATMVCKYEIKSCSMKSMGISSRPTPNGQENGVFGYFWCERLTNNTLMMKTIKEIKQNTTNKLYHPIKNDLF